MNNTTPINSKTVISHALLVAPYQLNIWFGLFIFVTGNISTIGNFFVFTSRTFRFRACSIYLIAESICTFFYINYVLVTRIIQKGFQLPIINRYDPICKIRQFLSEYTHQVALTLFIFASIDRLLSTHRSIVYRNWSNRISLAYKMTFLTVFLWFILIAHRLYFYGIATGSCRAQAGIYEKYDSYFEVIMSGFCPPVFIIIIGCLLIRNIRQIGPKRLALNSIVPSPNNGTSPSYIQQIDTQLTTMLLLQSFVAIPSFIPFGAQNFYSSITQTSYKSPLRLAWENVIIELIRLFSYVFYNTSFYISFASSPGFRRQVFRSLGIQRCSQRIDPINTIMQVKSTNTIRKIEQQQL